MMNENNKVIVAPIISFLMLVAGMILTAYKSEWFDYGYVKIIWFIIAYLPVGIPVMKEAWEEILNKNVFSEFTLMVIATLGAFFIGEYPEGVAVMLFYCVGELFQDNAVDKAKKNIKSLVDIRPDTANVIEGNTVKVKSPCEVNIGDEIEVKPGERVPLDGILLSRKAAFNTSALTGESLPRNIASGSEVLAGMISSDTVVCKKGTRGYSESALSRILAMVKDATDRKAPAELFIRKFAKIYTPFVICLAVLTIITPFFYSLYASSFVYIFDDWFYRALIFLVISCPCALVISVPLSYFGGMGEASRNGILFKGGNFMDAILKIKTVVFDKTGTLTKGVFEVTHIQTVSMPQENMLGLVASIEKSSNHPIAKAIVSYAEKKKLSSDSILRTNVKDIPGYGLSAEVDGDTFYVGTLRLLDKELISYPDELKNIPETIVACAKNNEYIGYLLLSDTLKDDAREAVTMLRGQDIKNIEILSGDKQALVTKVADELDVNAGYGDLLPEGKVRHIEELKKQYERGVAFVGDGINDAPVIALSDIGVAMGALGSDMAVETADLVIQTDHPSKVALAISIAKRTHRIVIQNVTMALGVKAIVLLLGVIGVATLWEAVFADVGVTILAIFNTMRLIRRK